ncbi:conserved protein of unknown function [Nitrosotalea devaniterrae]|uniref:Preprotein translocase subunit SecB n=1 Tax=Nitrosotalea devaniterrae TaxID=1078905 RepID=A0A128A2Z1_9ARCH|nr:conserved protein of unknown function [Candidatus Nitrosotalea devanaterra]
MNLKIELNSVTFSKLKKEQGFVKYNIEASLDEVENRDSEIILKYRLILLSNPTNAKITVEGMATLHGDQNEISKQLSPDEKNIPVVLNLIYQEIFPLFFIMSKSMQIPCPAYRLSQMSYVPQVEKSISETLHESDNVDVVDGFSKQSELHTQVELTSPLDQEQIIEQHV